MKVMKGGRDDLHEQALYALFDGVRGDRERMAEAEWLYSRLSYRGSLGVVPSGPNRSASEVPRPSDESSDADRT